MKKLQSFNVLADLNAFIDHYGENPDIEDKRYWITHYDLEVNDLGYTRYVLNRELFDSLSYGVFPDSKGFKTISEAQLMCAIEGINCFILKRKDKTLYNTDDMLTFSEFKRKFKRL